MKRRVQLWLYLCWFEAQRFKAYPHEIAAGLFSRTAELALYATFWIIVASFSSPGAINAIDIISFYMIISGLMPFFFSGLGIASMTADLIKTGQLNQTLIRPLNPIMYPWALRAGRNAINLLFGAVQIAIGIILGGGLSAEAWPFLLPVLFNTFALNAAFNVFVGASAFFVGDARGVKNAFLHMASFLRGERMPLFLMEPAFAKILLLTPFPASMYHLAILLQGTYLPTWNDVLIGCAWSVVLLWSSVQFWRFGLKKYEAVGI